MVASGEIERGRPWALRGTEKGAGDRVTETTTRLINGDGNKLVVADRAAHEWFRFVLSFPPHLVRDYLNRFEVRGDRRVLDPFCGTGTTLVEAKKLGVPSVGIESHPLTHFVSRTKLDWSPDPDGLSARASEIAETALAELAAEGIGDHPEAGAGHAANGRCYRSLPVERLALLLADSISPRPLHKTLTLLDVLVRATDPRYDDHLRLALAKALVTAIGNLHFGPEVGVGPAKQDAAVVAPWLAAVRVMADDLRGLTAHDATPSAVHRADARQVLDVLVPRSVGAVFTSPPYPNEKDYTRTTRLESVMLGFIRNREELQAVKRGLVRSNTRGVYKGDSDDALVAEYPEIQRIAAAIEARRLELGKTSGFERMYARVAKLYFGGMARHFADLRNVLIPGAYLGYVVGDQASYLRVMIRTGHLLAEIAASLGYEVVAIDLFRTRRATATRMHLNEEVVVLRWPG